MSANTPGERIAVLEDSLADQIAAGEVVERPASVVKELVENSIDAGATRVELELEGGGLERILVVDDGRGIHPEDLPLALRRHATSKIRRAEELVEIRTLGFRGEALASISAVARVRVRSRTVDAELGHELESRPGEVFEIAPRGMPQGTTVEVAHLFANVPARRKFMRSEATEVGHCSDAVIRVSLVHPEVSFSLRHGGRRILQLPAASRRERVEQVLSRRGPGPFHHAQGSVDGVRVEAWLAPPDSAARNRKGPYIVVRRRVVKDRSLAQIVGQAYGDALASGRQPVAALFVEPPPGTVDVNVHPQKAEVRFSDAQSVFAAVREVLRAGLAAAPWAFAQEETPRADPVVVLGGAPQPGASWMTSPDSSRWREPPSPVGGGEGGRGYRLGTRAASAGYAAQKASLRREAELLRSAIPRRGDGPDLRPQVEAAADASETDPRAHGPELLTCLPGPIALFADGEDLLAVDLRRLRSHLLYRRLAAELGGEGVAAQGLLPPAVVERPAEVTRLLLGAREVLEGIGVVLEPFGDDSLLVRAVPVALRSCVDEADVEDLVDRLVPWLRLRGSAASGAGGPRAREALEAVARTRGRDPGPRLARRWIRELVAEGVRLDELPGVRRWRGTELVRVD